MSSRKLFILFPIVEPYMLDLTLVESAGYTLIYKHSFPNDEPPYIMVDYWGIGMYKHTVYEEDGESITHYLIQTIDAKPFIYLRNQYQDDYCDGYMEGVYTRINGEHKLSPGEYVAGMSFIRKPKTKYIWELPLLVQRAFANLN